MSLQDKIKAAFEAERQKWQNEDQTIKAKLDEEAQIATDAGLWPMSHVGALLALNLAEDSLLGLIEEHVIGS